MPNSQQATQVMTIVAQGSITMKRGVALDGTQAGAGVRCFGPADHGGLQGEAIRVVTGVSAMWESGAAINGSVRTLKTDAQGRVIPTSDPEDVVCAILLPGQTASGAGEFPEVMPVR
jgi:hypothetical protein